MSDISNEELIEFLKKVADVNAYTISIADEAEAIIAKLQPPPLKKIDLSNLDPRVPVRVLADYEYSPADVFISEGNTLERLLQFDGLTLKTDRWVFNDLGTNPWPEGCVVEVDYTNGSRNAMNVKNINWSRMKVSASRYIGPAEGWEE